MVLVDHLHGGAVSGAVGMATTVQEALQRNHEQAADRRHEK
jgi:hypothetical protein